MTASIRAYSFGGVGTNPTLTVAMPTHASSDHIYLFGWAYGEFAVTTGACAAWTVPSGWALSADLPITESATVVGRFGVFTRAVASGEAVSSMVLTNPCNATARQMYFRSVSIRDVGGTPGLDVVATGPFQVADQPLPVMPVVQDDTIVLVDITSIGDTAGIGVDVALPYDEVVGVASPVLYGGEHHLWATDPQDADVPATAMVVPVPLLNTSGANGWYAILGVALVPAFVVPPAVGAPDLARLRLGCADDYRVFVTASDYETVIDGIAWSDLEWSRVLDEPSTATVTVPDRYGGLRCCAHLGGLVPWRYGLRLERDDKLVWSGPVTNVQRQAESLRVSASDVMARFQKRLATRYVDYRFDNADAGIAFGTTVVTAQMRDADDNFTEPWHVHPPEVLVGAAIKRDVLVRDFEMAWDILNDLAEASVDFWVGNGVLYMHQPGTGWMYYDGGETVRLDGPYTSGGHLVYGTFTEDAFIGLPTWSVNGWSQANTGWVPGADIGESGARRYWTARNGASVVYDGVLDQVETFNLYRPEEEEEIPEAVFQQFADGLVAIRGVAPPIMEGTMLAESAPVDVDHLRPGSLWQIDVWDACYGQLLQLVRLKRVTVRASKSGDGVTETVEPVLFPPGHDG